MESLRIQSLSFHHLGPIDFSLEATQCICLSGESGAGKTLLLRSIADLDSHQGEVYLNDVACQSIPAPLWRKKVGFLPAESHWWYDTVGEHFTQLTEQKLMQVGFQEDVSEWQISQLSSGERQRLALLRLLQNFPSVLLLDEPTASLDPKNVDRVEEVVKNYAQEHQAALLWISHDPEQVKRVADQHFVIEGGKMIEQKIVR